MRTRRGEVLLGYALELLVSALRGARTALGRMIGDDEDANLRPAAPKDGRARRRDGGGAGRTGTASSGHGAPAAAAPPRGTPSRGVPTAKTRAGADIGDAAADREMAAAGTRRSAAAGRAETTREAPSAETLRDALDTAPSLPTSYADDRLVLLARDPGNLFAYWDLAPGFDRPRDRGARLMLRIENMTLLDFEAARPWQQQDIEVDGLVGSRYVEVAQAAGTYRAQLGWRDRDGHFVARVRSATVTTPRADAPGHEPVRWMTVAVEGSGRERATGEAPSPPTADEGTAASTPARRDPTGHAAPSAEARHRVASSAVHGAPSSAEWHRAPPTSGEVARRAPSSVDLHRAPSSGELPRRPPSSAELQRRAPSSDVLGRRPSASDALHRRGG